MVILSIVIPIYNTKKYLEDCVNSCIAQDIPSDRYEIILIDDGSTDGSALIADQLKKGFDNINVVHQENQGLSASRNNGLNIANGKYVWFVDSDDTITKNILSRISSYMDSDIDLIHLNHQLTFENSTRTEEIKDSRQFKNIRSGKDVLSELGGLPTPAQLTIYRREFLIHNALSFKVGILHEDAEFKPRAVYCAKTVIWINEICYNYLQRNSGSITTSFSIKNVQGILSGIDSLMIFNNSIVKENGCKRAIRKIIGVNYNNIIYNFSRIGENNKCSVLNELRKKKYIINEICKSYKLAYMVESLIFRLNIRLGILIYTCLKR